MYESTVIQKLNILLSEKEEAAMLLPESVVHLSEYQNTLAEFLNTKEPNTKAEAEEKLLKMFSLKKEGYGYVEDGMPDILVYKHLRDIIGNNVISEYYYVAPVCDGLIQKAYQWKMLLERTQQALKVEKFKPDIKPIVTLIKEEKRDERHIKVYVDCAIIIIINNHSFVRLKITSEKIEERIQRAIRKDIIDVLLRDNQLSFVFHSIRDQITVDLSSYKEARELQEAIHSIRNTPMFTRNGSR